MRILMAHPGAGWSVSDVHDGLLPALRAQGHHVLTYALDQRITVSKKYLQLAWRHSDKTAEKPTWADAMYLAAQGILERALRFEVDYVLVISAMFLHPDAVVLLRRAGIKVGIVFTESPYDDRQQGNIARYVDACWTNERSSVPFLSLFCPNVFYLPHAYDPARHHVGLEDDPDVAAHDVVFVGTAFHERIAVLKAVNWDGIDLGLYGNWKRLGSRAKLRQYVRGGVTDNAKTAALYRKAKVGLNLHRTSMDWGKDPTHIEFAESLNPRAYELAACGSFTISDHRPELDEVFGPLVPSFNDTVQLEGLVRHYLAHEDERRELAARLPLAVAGQTFAQRAQQITTNMEEVLERQCEPSHAALA